MTRSARASLIREAWLDEAHYDALLGGRHDSEYRARLRALSGEAHGWVTPREDGTHLRCGGPPVCPDCKAEQADLESRNVDVVWAVQLGPGMVTEDGREVEWVNGREVGFTDGSTVSVTWLPIRRGPPMRSALKTGRNGSRVDVFDHEAEAALGAVREAVAAYQESQARASADWEQTVAVMLKARNAGVSMARIGQEVGLTRERVRQIVNAWESNGGSQ